MMARALEVVGERWSLLIVRDLLLGPRRFTDLLRGLTEITPTRLTGRLRQLEAAGIVEREPPSTGREVWYRLTHAGRDLDPVVEALVLWGIEHTSLQPRAREPVHPIPVMIGTKVWLSRHAPKPGRLTWIWRFPDDEAYTIRSAKGAWSLARGEAERADVIVDASAEAWARLLTAPAGSRNLRSEEIVLTAEPAAIEQFAATFAFEHRPRQKRPRRRA